MAPQVRLYPRNTIKRIVKAHSNKLVTKNVDILIFLDYSLFLQTLIREASINAKRTGERGLTTRSVRKVTEDSLRRFKG